MLIFLLSHVALKQTANVKSPSALCQCGHLYQPGFPLGREHEQGIGFYPIILNLQGSRGISIILGTAELPGMPLNPGECNWRHTHPARLAGWRDRDTCTTPSPPAMQGSRSSLGTGGDTCNSPGCSSPSLLPHTKLLLFVPLVPSLKTS